LFPPGPIPTVQKHRVGTRSARALCKWSLRIRLRVFDSDQLPGAAFSPDTGRGTAIPATDLTGLNVGSEADAIWNSEFGLGATKKFFMGQTTSSNFDGNPSAKTASTFKYMRGHAPDETNTQGSYYAASIAKFAHGTYDGDGNQLSGVRGRPNGHNQGTQAGRYDFSRFGFRVAEVPDVLRGQIIHAGAVFQICTRRVVFARTRQGRNGAEWVPTLQFDHGHVH
jgi:hypothetical protein